MNPLKTDSRQTHGQPNKPADPAHSRIYAGKDKTALVKDAKDVLAKVKKRPRVPVWDRV